MNFKNNEKLRAKIFFAIVLLLILYITVGKNYYREYKIYKDEEQERLLIENVDDKYSYIFEEENIYQADGNYDQFLIDLYRDLDEFKEFILEFKIANNIIKDDDYSIFRTYEELIRDNMRHKEDKLNKEDEVYEEYFIFLNDLAYNLKIINKDLKIDKDEELYINNMLAFIESNLKKYEDDKEKANNLYEKFEIKNYKIKEILDYLNYLKLRDFIKESKDNKDYNLLFESEKDYKIKREKDEFYKIYLKRFEGKKQVNEKSINLAKQAILKLGIGEDKLKLDENSLITDKYNKLYYENKNIQLYIDSNELSLSLYDRTSIKDLIKRLSDLDYKIKDNSNTKNKELIYALELLNKDESQTDDFFGDFKFELLKNKKGVISAFKPLRLYIEIDEYDYEASLNIDNLENLMNMEDELQTNNLKKELDLIKNHFKKDVQIIPVINEGVEYIVNIKEGNIKFSILVEIVDNKVISKKIDKYYELETINYELEESKTKNLNKEKIDIDLKKYIKEKYFDTDILDYEGDFKRFNNAYIYKLNRLKEKALELKYLEDVEFSREIYMNYLYSDIEEYIEEINKNKHFDNYLNNAILLNDIHFDLNQINKDNKIKENILYIDNIILYLQGLIDKHQEIKTDVESKLRQIDFDKYNINIDEFVNLKNKIIYFSYEQYLNKTNTNEDFFDMYNKDLNNRVRNEDYKILLKDWKQFLDYKYKINNEYVIDKVDKIFKSVINKLNLDIKYLKSDIKDYSMRLKIKDEYTKIYYDYDDKDISIYIKKTYSKDIKELQNTLNKLSYKLHKQTLDEDENSYLYYKIKENYIDESDNINIIVDRNSEYVKIEINRVDLFLEETDDKEFSDRENKMVKEDLNLIKSVLNVDDLKITPIKSYEEIYYQIVLNVNQKAYKKEIFVEDGEIEIR